MPFIILVATLLFSTTAYTLASNCKIKAVRGSVERRIAASVAVYAALATLMLGMSLSSLLWLTGNHALSAVIIPLLVIWVFSLREDLKDDDWHNDQWKRLKRWLKELRRRLSQSPLPSPAA